MLAEVHYLSDLGDEEEKIDKLPICVKEIASEGPGLISVKFRIEVQTNSGVVLGFAEMDDTEEDFRRVVGRESLYLLAGRREEWDLGLVFQHIVEERLVLDMLGGRKNDNSKASSDGSDRNNKNNRRFGFFRATTEKAVEASVDTNDENKATTSNTSLITLIRDKPSEPLDSIGNTLRIPSNKMNGVSITTSNNEINEKSIANEFVDEIKVDDKFHKLSIHKCSRRLVGRPLRMVN